MRLYIVYTYIYPNLLPRSFAGNQRLRSAAADASSSRISSPALIIYIYIPTHTPTYLSIYLYIYISIYSIYIYLLPRSLAGKPASSFRSRRRKHSTRFVARLHYIYIYIHTHTHAHIYLSIYLSISIYLSMRLYIVYICVCIPVAALLGGKPAPPFPSRRRKHSTRFVARLHYIYIYIYNIHTHTHAHIYLSIYLSIYTQAPPAFRLPPWLYIYIPSHTHTNISIYLPTVCMYTYIPVAALLCEKNISRAPLTQTLAPRAFRLPPWLYIIYTYPHTHTHTHSHTHIYIYVCTHTYMYIYIHVYIYRSIDLSIYVSISISIVYV